MSAARSQRVLLAGLKASVVDFDKWPQLSTEILEQAFRDALRQLQSAGFEASWCLTDTGETAEQQLTDEIRSTRPDVVLVGAGVRSDPDHMLLFERMINVIHREAPAAKIVFNTSPHDTVEAVRRWV